MKAALLGDWSGRLEYRDFQSDKRVSLPTQVSALLRDGSCTLSFTFDDGPGKTVRSTEVWSIDDATRTLRIQSANGTDTLTLVESDSPMIGAAVIVGEGRGIENDQPVRTRLILSSEGGHLRVSRLTSKTGELFLMRDAYELSGTKSQIP